MRTSILLIDGENVQLRKLGRLEGPFKVKIFLGAQFSHRLLLGSLAAAHPEACFHVISGDTGFDPLIQHLAVNQICCMRCKTVEEVRLHADVHAILDNLATRKDAKPRTLKALRNTIKALLAHVDDSRLDALLGQLTSRGDIVLDGAKVAYGLAT